MTKEQAQQILINKEIDAAQKWEILEGAGYTEAQICELILTTWAEGL